MISLRAAQLGLFLVKRFDFLDLTVNLGDFTAQEIVACSLIEKRAL